MRRILFIASFLFLATAGHGQLENANWYFGYTAAVGFTSGAPVPITGSGMNAIEGCAAISSAAGDLLFYTNGAQVWNANNVIMPGPLLSGSNISTQAALVVPHPGNPDQYFVFATDTWEFTPTELRYSIVDMSLNGGLGGLGTLLNVLLDTNVREQVAATQHANGQDYWIVSHQANNQHFIAYRLTPLGLDTVPVISNTGMLYAGLNRWGGLRFSQDCKRLVSCLGSGAAVNETVELYDFDNATGAVTNPRLVDSYAHQPGAYSAEFSPGGAFLYVTGYNSPTVTQYTLSAPYIDSTAVDIAVGHSGIKCGLLMAPDGKLYVGNPNTHYLDAIPFPDSPGLACGYQDSAVYLDAGTDRLALPNQVARCTEISTAVMAPQPSAAPMIYPDPFSTSFTLSMPTTGAIHLLLHDATGRVVFAREENVSAGSGTWIEPGPLADGLYVLELRTDRQRWVHSVVKQGR